MRTRAVVFEVVVELELGLAEEAATEGLEGIEAELGLGLEFEFEFEEALSVSLVMSRESSGPANAPSGGTPPSAYF